MQIGGGALPNFDLVDMPGRGQRAQKEMFGRLRNRKATDKTAAGKDKPPGPPNTPRGRGKRAADGGKQAPFLMGPLLVFVRVIREY